MIKAIAGGGGRGMRIVDDAEKLEEAYARCQSEAKAAFGSDGVYVERLIRNARHIEVQIIGDHHGAISHLWERECTIQRRNQKLIEVAPSPSLNDGLARAHHPGRQGTRRRRELRQSRHLRVPGRWRRQRRRAGLRLHRSQSAAAGRAHRDRGGARRRSRAGAACGRRRRHARLARTGAGLYPKTARLCDAAARQHGGDGRDRRHQADRRHARAVRPAGRPRRARRYVRLFRLQDQRGLRLAARQGDRAFDRRRTGPMWCRRPRAPCASSASAASPPTFRSSAAMLAHPDFIANRINTGFIDAHVAALVHAANDLAAPELVGSGRCRDRVRCPRNLRPVRPARSRCRRRCRARSSRSRSAKATSSAPASRSRCSNP